MKFGFSFPVLRCARESLLFLLNALNDRQTDRLDFATPPSSRLSEKLSTRPSIFFHLSSVRQQGSFLVVRFLVSLELSSQSALLSFSYCCVPRTHHHTACKVALHRSVFLTYFALARLAINSRANPWCTHGCTRFFSDSFSILKKLRKFGRDLKPNVVPCGSGRERGVL